MPGEEEQAIARQAPFKSESPNRSATSEGRVMDYVQLGLERNKHRSDWDELAGDTSCVASFAVSASTPYFPQKQESMNEHALPQDIDNTRVKQAISETPLIRVSQGMKRKAEVAEAQDLVRVSE
ncbi:hypothetical protein FRC07_011262 [Ceratobasidium sp. 392]|nr:hypothetical protein FRC07_011262 [Ceratobasidium sp. 392]